MNGPAGTPRTTRDSLALSKQDIFATGDHPLDKFVPLDVECAEKAGFPDTALPVSPTWPRHELVYPGDTHSKEGCITVSKKWEREVLEQ